MQSSVKLSEVYLDLRKLQKGTPCYTVSIYDSVFYKCLVDSNREVYDEYRNTLRQINPELDRQMTYDEYINLGYSILNKGWNSDEYIHLRKYRKNSYKVTDAAHRCALLLYFKGDINLRCTKNGRKWGIYLPNI